MKGNSVGEFWYEVPHQVWALGLNIGIVFHNYFVDAKSGKAWRLKDLQEAGRLIGIPEDDIVWEYDDWIDFSKTIGG